MRIGQLRKQIAIQQEQPTPDGAGGYALAWATLATVWGDVSPVTGREFFVAGHLESHVTHKVTIRWRSADYVHHSAQNDQLDLWLCTVGEPSAI